MTIRGGDLRVTRTRAGYVAVLRVQGWDGEIGIVGTCTEAEARAVLRRHARRMQAAGVGISLGGLFRGIGKIAGKIAKLKVLRQLVSVAKFLPPPISTVASVAQQSLTVMSAMGRGNRQGLAAWKDAAARARAAPHSPTALGMQLAMAARGPATFRAGASSTAVRDLAREVMADLEAGPAQG